MKSIPDINQQLANLMMAIARLNAMQATVHSVMLLGSKPVIRIARDCHCIRLSDEGKASYSYFGHNRTGRFRQGTFELNSCRVIWSESLIN